MHGTFSFRQAFSTGLVCLVISTSACEQKKEPAKTTSGNIATQNFSTGNALTAPVDYLGAVEKAKRNSQYKIQLAPLQQAIQSFRAQEDRLPTDLNELVAEGVLDKIPPAPKGMKYLYSAETGKLELVPQ
jgi:hypothetical protein